MKNNIIIIPFLRSLSAAILLIVLSLPGHRVQAQVLNTNDTLILDRIVAVVGKYPILQSDIENTLIEYRQRMALPNEPKCFILESLLINKLLVNQAEIDSVEVTDEDVQRSLDNKLQEFILMAGSQENLESSFKKSLLEMKQDFFKPQKEAMIAEKMKNEITVKLTITPSEVQKFYRQIPATEIPLRPASLEIREIVLRPEITEAEIVRVQDRLKEFRERIQKGEASFTTLAVLYSEDKASSSRGGDLGPQPRSQLVPEFAAVAFNLKGDEISRVVKTDFGYHIIQQIDRRGDVINCKHILLSPKPTVEAKAMVKARLDSLSLEIRQNRISFEAAALKYSTSKKTKANGGLMVNTGSPQEPNSQNVNTTWFEPQELSREIFDVVKNLKPGEISKVIETYDENNALVYKVFSVKSSRPAHKADLKQDYQYLQVLALNDKKQKEINTWIEKKQESMYIRIDKDFQGCPYEHKGWIK
jgi:peptidyl-prolyl cis-trans isomerase SurA